MQSDIGHQADARCIRSGSKEVDKGCHEVYINSSMTNACKEKIMIIALPLLHGGKRPAGMEVHQAVAAMQRLPRVLSAQQLSAVSLGLDRADEARSCALIMLLLAASWCLHRLYLLYHE